MSKAGNQFKFIYFWGPTPEGEIGPQCFSQWYKSPFDIDEDHYLTAEHYMMAQKAKLFGDHDMRQQILEVEHPGEARSLGRKVRGFSNEVWLKHRFEIVVEGNIAKFSSREDYREYLLGTNDRVLVEASPKDRIWGIGLGAEKAKTISPEEWRGLNLLGFSLMEARRRLRASLVV